MKPISIRQYKNGILFICNFDNRKNLFLPGPAYPFSIRQVYKFLRRLPLL